MKRRTLLTGAALGAMTGRAIAQPSCQGVDRTRLRPTFAEEFNKFDAAPNGRDPRTGAAVWRTTFSWGKDPLRTLPSNKEVQFYSDTSVGLDPFRLAGGVLTIEARPRARGAVIPEGLTYTSGLITTQESFAQTYGYFEFRARMPRGRGFWPALWLPFWPPCSY